MDDAEADRIIGSGRPPSLDEMSDSIQRLRRGIGASMCAQGNRMQHGKPYPVVARDHQPDSREGQAGPDGVAERPAIPRRPGNAGGGKGPWFKVNARSGESLEIGDEPTNSG